MNVAALEQRLLARYPAATAEPWDRVGLSVGDPAAEVTGVVCALDADERAVAAAIAARATVVVAHHPVYLEAPRLLAPTSRAVPAAAGAAVAALKAGISILSLHTNLDRARDARRHLAAQAGIAATGSLEHPAAIEEPGIGMVGSVPTQSLRAYAARMAAAFETEPRVWGSPEREVHTVAFVNGSGGSFGESALALGVDVLLTGEVGYHTAVDLVARGLALIELGHDRSEAPLVAVLAAAVRAAGIPPLRITTAPVPRLWWTQMEGDPHGVR